VAGTTQAGGRLGRSATLAYVPRHSVRPGAGGAAFGHTKIEGKSLLVRGLNALAATISTPLAAPVSCRHPAGWRQRGLGPGALRPSPPHRSLPPVAAAAVHALTDQHGGTHFLRPSIS